MKKPPSAKPASIPAAQPIRRIPRDFPVHVLKGQGPVARLLREGRLYPVFQPIVALDDGGTLAHEALIRGPVDSPLHAPDRLLDSARREGLLFEFELEAMFRGIEVFADTLHFGRLFVNVGAEALLGILETRGVETLRRLLTDTRFTPRRLVFEITEHERVRDMDALANGVEILRRFGAQFALDDFGDGHSSLRLWSQIKPEFVKIDKYFTRDIAKHAENLQTLRALMQIADLFGSRLVAEGIETAADLRVLRDLGIPNGQGYYLGRPDRVPRRAAEAAQNALNDRRIAVLPELKRVASHAATRPLDVIPAPHLHISSSNTQLIEFLLEHPTLPGVALLDDEGIPRGLVNRHHYMTAVARPFFKEIFGRLPCIEMANQTPRILEAGTDIDELLAVLTSDDQRYLTEGFIVTRDGRYAGLGTGEQLVRSVTEMRIEAARHANPLTFLPGNIPITQHIERLLARGVGFVACYADLNHFKPFNDQYGYWRGDEMICLLARHCVAECDPQNDFVGHVGGDDFILLLQSADWEVRCRRVLAGFDSDAALLFDPEARQLGGLYCEDRQGVTRFFPLTTLSIGALPVVPGAFTSAEAVANQAAHAKHLAKVGGGGLAVFDFSPAAAGSLPPLHSPATPLSGGNVPAAQPR